MTRVLAVDPGKNSGIALGYYDATTPYQLLERWQVHDGVDGLLDWLEQKLAFDEIVCEKFILGQDNAFAADLTPVQIEGIIIAEARRAGVPIIWQPRTDKAALTGYPASAVTKAQRQRVRFDWLKEHGLFRAGTENDDSNDAIVHALVSLKRRRHMPTLRRYWAPKRSRIAA